MDAGTFRPRLESVQGQLSTIPSDAECHGLTHLQILQFSIYCPRTQSGPEEDLFCQKGERLWYFYGSINIEEEVARHINSRCGAVAVAGVSPILISTNRGLKVNVAAVRCCLCCER
jgi:hypothetical protein